MTRTKSTIGFFTGCLTIFIILMIFTVPAYGTTDNSTIETPQVTSEDILYQEETMFREEAISEEVAVPEQVTTTEQNTSTQTEKVVEFLNLTNEIEYLNIIGGALIVILLASLAFNKIKKGKNKDAIIDTEENLQEPISIESETDSYDNDASDND